MRYRRNTLILATPVFFAAVLGGGAEFGTAASANEISVATTVKENSTRINPSHFDEASDTTQGADTRPEPFQTKGVAIPDGTHYWKKWLRVATAIPYQLSAAAACSDKDCVSDAALKFRKIVDGSLQQNGRARLDRVNRAVNLAVRYTTDVRTRGISDYWATPYETLGSGKGDCEDYAITKYALLRAMNWPEDDLRLVVVYGIAVRDYHMVLAVHLREDWLILDNVSDVIEKDDKLRRIYFPFVTVDGIAVRLLWRPATGVKSGMKESSSLE